ERHAVEGAGGAVSLLEAAQRDVGGARLAQRKSLFQRSVHFGRCLAITFQSNVTSFAKSAWPLISFFADPGVSFTVLWVGLKNSSEANAVCTSGERYMSMSFHARSLFLLPRATWMT